MPASADGILTATFDTEWAAVRLIVDGSHWPSSVDAVSITRQVAGQASIPVRGIEARPAIGGYFVGSDSEAPQGVPVTYTVAGTLAGAAVAAASVTVATDGAADGLWIKVPGKPDLTVRVPIREVSDVSSPTVGGVYPVAGGGSIAQTTAQWSGIETDKAKVTVAAAVGPMMTRLRAALAAGRVLLLQPVGVIDLDPDWYFIDDVTRANPAARADGFPQRWFALSVQRTGIPAGSGQGLPGVSYAVLSERFETYDEMTTSGLTYFDLQQGAWS